jgi:hypothetical protein
VHCEIGLSEQFCLVFVFLSFGCYNLVFGFGIQLGVLGVGAFLFGLMTGTAIGNAMT